MGMGTLMTIHGEVRWLVVILAVVIIIKFAIGWLGKRNYAPVSYTHLDVYKRQRQGRFPPLSPGY